LPYQVLVMELVTRRNDRVFSHRPRLLNANPHW
jgi:hypothetical protein